MSADPSKPQSLMQMLDDVDRAAHIDNPMGRAASELHGAVQSAAGMVPPPQVDTKGGEAPKTKQGEGKIARGGESGPISAPMPKAAPKPAEGRDGLGRTAEMRARSGPIEGTHRAPPINLVTAAARIPPRPPEQTSTRTRTK